ncbi:MAG: CheR family methyltransferase [bacterium]
MQEKESASRFFQKKSGDNAGGSPGGHESELSRDEEKEREALTGILALLRNVTGSDFTQYKYTTISRRITRRMALQKIPEAGDYLKYLIEHPAEVMALYEDILIKVTAFFREQEVFQTLQSRVLPALMRDRQPDLPIRVWVPGCSTGEEAYSIAICLLEFFDGCNCLPPIQIFGTDIDGKVIETARSATYPENPGISPERLQRFFIRTEDGCRIASHVRELCTFARQDVTKDPPLSNMDLISCRNLLIYLGQDLQQRVIRLFHYALKSGGFLILGSSESAALFSDLFPVVDKKNKIYVKGAVTSSLPVDFTTQKHTPEMMSVGKGKENRGEEQASGAFNLHTTTDCAQVRGLKPGESESTHLKGDQGNEETEGLDEHHETVVRLRRELAATRANLQSTIEEQESTNEELRAANEEIQSSNEELQSTNEELEAAKEELEAANGKLADANEKLRERNSELDQIFNTAADGMRVIDKNFTILRINKTLLNLSGLSRADEAVGKKCYETFPGPLCHTSDCPLIKILHGEERVECDTEKKRQDGTMIPCIVTATPFRKPDGEVLGIVEDFKDITERKKAEKELARRAEELARSNADLQQFAYVASHDLQEPLRMVASYMQLLSRRYKGRLDSSADDFIAYAVDGAVRMQGLINDLLSYSRVGTHGKEFQPIDSTVVLNQAIANLQEAIAESGTIITFDPLPTLMADGPQLVHLFQNLISNAIKFHGQEPPLIHITVEPRGKTWLFSISDNGIGIDPEYAERIFVIFQRLHNKAEYPGTGIGLAICKRIVERHGGRIWVKSEPGKGATFYFTLPR